MKFSVIIVLFLYVSLPLLAQNNWHFSGITTLNSLSEKQAEESLPLLDSKKNQLYFVRTGYLENKHDQDIWMSQWNGTEWLKAKPLPYPINTAHNEAVVAIHDSNLLIWRALTLAGEKLNKFYFVKRNGTAFQEPVQLNLPEINSQGNYMGAYINQKGNLIIASLQNEYSKGEEDLFVIRQNAQGNWIPPSSLGEVINTAGFEISPFYLEDEKTLFFASNGRNDSEGSDIYYATRKNKWNGWTIPQKVSGVNSKSFDAYFYYEKTNKKAYWTSNRNNKKADLFVAELAEPDVAHTKLSIAKKEIKYDKLLDFLEEPVEKLSIKKTGDIHIYFEKDASDLQPEMKKLLQMLAKRIDSNYNFQLKIMGFADDTGTEDYNLKLSEARALKVKNYLLKLGLPSDNMTIEPMGEVKGSSGDTAMHRELNRRVDIIITH
jgi:outer membrane protein OmpA-like peptidoglycan-associated protein